jgi:hypothetical protein
VGGLAAVAAGAAELDEPLPNLSYHVKTLERLGVIELTGTTSPRGAIEHFYRGRWRVRTEAERID